VRFKRLIVSDLRFQQIALVGQATSGPFLANIITTVVVGCFAHFKEEFLNYFEDNIRTGDAGLDLECVPRAFSAWRSAAGDTR
jgi:hypothetical protein